MAKRIRQFVVTCAYDTTTTREEIRGEIQDALKARYLDVTVEAVGGKPGPASGGVEIPLLPPHLEERYRQWLAQEVLREQGR